MAGINRFEEDEFAAAYEFADKSSRQISRFMNYLESHPRSRRLGEGDAQYNTDVQR